MLARPLVHNAPFPATFSSLYLDGTFDTPALTDTAYSDSVIIGSGSGTYGNERVLSGALPDGLSLSVVASELILSGTPTVAGTFQFIAAVSDTVRGWTTYIESTIVVKELLVILGVYSNGGFGVPYSSALTITGGDGVYSSPAVASGTKPNGLNLSIVGDQLILSGTPSLVDTFDFTVSCNSGDGQSATSEAQTVDIS